MMFMTVLDLSLNKPANEFNNLFMMSSPTALETFTFSLSVFAEAAEAKDSRQSQRICEMGLSPALMCTFILAKPSQEQG